MLECVSVLCARMCMCVCIRVYVHVYRGVCVFVSCFAFMNFLQYISTSDVQAILVDQMWLVTSLLHLEFQLSVWRSPLEFMEAC